MHQGDYGSPRSEPWTYSRNSLPVKVYSTLAMWKTGKNGALRPRYRKTKKHLWRIEDAQRVIAKIVPPEDQDGEDWARHVVRVLRDATISMLSRILFFLPSSQIDELYEFVIGMLDKFFGVVPPQDSPSIFKAKQLILYVADRVGIGVTFKQ